MLETLDRKARKCIIPALLMRQRQISKARFEPRKRSVGGTSSRNPIQRIWLQPSTGTIDYVEVTRDGALVHEATKAENAAVLADYGLDATQFEYPVVFDFDQQITSALLVDRELNVRVTSSASNSLTAIVEHRAKAYV